MSKTPKEMERAQAAFHRKEAQAREGVTAMAEYHAVMAAERKKTERLRALRLAKEKQDRDAAEKAALEKPKAAPKKKR